MTCPLHSLYWTVPCRLGPDLCQMTYIYVLSDTRHASSKLQRWRLLRSFTRLWRWKPKASSRQFKMPRACVENTSAQHFPLIASTFESFTEHGNPKTQLHVDLVSVSCRILHELGSCARIRLSYIHEAEPRWILSDCLQLNSGGGQSGKWAAGTVLNFRKRGLHKQTFLHDSFL